MERRCPICGSEVQEGPEVPQADFEGRAFLFCGEACKTLFLQYPESFSEERGEEVKVLEDTAY